eukprot:CAMPEP_0175090398 /NCGR_PEP_ID=MMETSP0086_2-20121207/1322_1 /TAXON_ID=136419 /ORGANISM="Unknown Unknown, Strain D1" /LENGTH=376 /DNA_ID=CAMNT_0016363019 /DNA_START=55 /DNA_END=1186 /DNA_ORIENTATION=+
MAAEGKKIFVGGLSWETTDETFKAFFEKFGAVEESMVMRNNATGHSRGFGFVTFAEASSAEATLTGGLEIEGRKVDCKIAVPRESRPPMGGAPYDGAPRTKKIFVGGLPPETTNDSLKGHFAQFGDVTEAIVMIDSATQRSRGFGFVTFETEDMVDKVLTVSSHTIDGKTAECKKAMPKKDIMRRDMMGPPRGGGGTGDTAEEGTTEITETLMALLLDMGVMAAGGYGGGGPRGYGYGGPPARYGRDDHYGPGGGGGYGGGYGGGRGGGGYPPPGPGGYYGEGYPPAADYGYGGHAGHGAPPSGVPGAVGDHGFGEFGASAAADSYGAGAGANYASYASSGASSYGAAPSGASYGSAGGASSRSGARSDRSFHPYR